MRLLSTYVSIFCLSVRALMRSGKFASAIFLSSLALLTSGFSAVAQTNPPSEENQTENSPSIPQSAQNKTQTTQIGAVATVKDNIVVTAGLLTQPSATQLFGGWTAEHFLVVQVTIGNQSRDQQFVLHDIFLDYSNWKLSGIYQFPSNNGQCTDTPQGTSSCLDSRPLQVYQSGTQPGQISSIGGLEVQEALKQNSVFSKRNFVVNGLVFLGASAGGFVFLGPLGFTQGVAGFSSSFVPALQKFWPDRRIDQQSNLLKYGFQDKMVIAKEDPGKTYAFFPIERMLSKGLIDVYRQDPAIFLNMAALYFDPPLTKEWYAPSTYTKSNAQLDYLRELVDQLLYEQIKAANGAWSGQRPHNCSKRHLDPKNRSDSACINFNARILSDLLSSCYWGTKSTENPNGEDNCMLAPSRSATPQSTSPSAPQSTPPATTESAPLPPPTVEEIRAVKDAISGLSLNKIRVVVNGIMTVDVDLIPGMLTKITFEDDDPSKSVWEDTSSEHSGVIEGKYLTNGTPEITAIKSKDGTTITGAVKNYISSITADPDSSTDTELHFKFKLSKPIPTGSILTFRVNKSSGKSVNNSGVANTQETTSSMTLDYSVVYQPAATIKFDSGDLTTVGPVKGHLEGSNLDGKTIAIKLFTINRTAATLTDYISEGPTLVATGSGDTQVNFTLTVKAIPAGATIMFVGKDKSGTEVDATPINVPQK